MDTLYIEKEIRDHPTTLAIQARFPQARHIAINRYGDVFNATGQNFRHQKSNPALILAYKSGNRVHATPPGYHVGGKHNYYFSHMLNCVYDCRYCFLQGMYQSGNYVVFVNHNDFFDDIARTAQSHDEPSWYFSGYDCDSLALDPITGFIDSALDFFSTQPDAFMEIRTKSTQIRPLLKRTALDNVVVAYSLSPQAIVEAEEHGTPSLEKRLQALNTLHAAGWKIGLRFDPLLYADNFNALYAEFFDKINATLDMASVHSVSLGVFRLPRSFHKKLIKLYPDAKILAAPIERRGNLMSYPEALENQLREFCVQRLNSSISPSQFFPCS